MREALRSGNVDSTLISSSNPNGWPLPEHKYLLKDSVGVQVALVVTRDASWNRIPFLYRAMIGDAAIMASEQQDRTLISAEDSLLAIADKYDVSSVAFQRDDAARATLQWINRQPEALRTVYRGAFDQVRRTSSEVEPKPSFPPKGSLAGRIYFATTREDTGNQTLEYRFGDARTDIVKCGEIEFPIGNGQTGSARFAGAITADSDQCGLQMNAALQSSKRLLLFIHGFNNRFAEAAERAILLKSTLRDKAEVLMWSWPSKRDGLGANYDYDKESASGVAQEKLVRLLKAMAPASKSASLDLLAHSMGGWHTIGALRVLSSGDSYPVLQNVALAAPDIPKDEFVFALGDMRRVTKRLTLYACAWDFALMVSQQINAFPRAGTGGADSIVVSDQLESIDVDGKFASTNHSYVFEAGKVLTDLTLLIVNDNDAAQRGLTKQNKSPWYYWIFQ